MATLRECHDALESRLSTIPGLHTFNHPPQGGTPPMAYPVFRGWVATTMGRASQKTYRFDVYILTAVGGRSDVGYFALLEYAESSGTKSIELAIWDGNDRAAGTFAGLPFTQAATTGGFDELGTTQMDELQMYGGLFTVEITTKG